MSTENGEKTSHSSTSTCLLISEYDSDKPGWLDGNPFYVGWMAFGLGWPRRFGCSAVVVKDPRGFLFGAGVRRWLPPALDAGLHD